MTGVSPVAGTGGTEVTLPGSGFGERRGEVLLGAEKCYVFWGYICHAWYMDGVESKWMMSDIENLGPDGN